MTWDMKSERTIFNIYVRVVQRCRWKIKVARIKHREAG